MSKQTFDFSEALRRMKEGKNVRRKNSEYIFAICGGGCFPQTISYRTCVSNMFSLGVAAIPTECILATDWGRWKDEEENIDPHRQQAVIRYDC